MFLTGAPCDKISLEGLTLAYLFCFLVVFVTIIIDSIIHVCCLLCLDFARPL